MFSSPIVTGVDDDRNFAPRSFSLSQNYPNPFNPSTHIKFSLAERTDVRLEVFDLLGRRIKSLAEADLSAGEHEFVWDGNDESGSKRRQRRIFLPSYRRDVSPVP